MGVKWVKLISAQKMLGQRQSQAGVNTPFKHEVPLKCFS
jgi:hypothetical protein